MTTKPPDLTPAHNPLESLGAEDQKIIAELQEFLGVSTEDVCDMLEAVQRGESMGDYFGYTPEVCRAIEHAALAYYRTGRYEQAINIFAWLVDVTGGAYTSAWRGIGACHQANKAFAAAIPAYRHALLANPDDRLSQVFCGECLCYVGEQEEGIRFLQGAIAKASKTETLEPHIVRAKAIIEAHSSRPQAPNKNTPHSAPAPASKKKSEAVHEPASEAAAQRAARFTETAQPTATKTEAAQPTATETEAAQDDAAGIEAAVRKEVIAHTYDEAMQGVMADPELKAQLERLTEAVRNRQLTLKEVADFSDEQMDAGYTVACQFLERGDALKALETTGWLLWIDSRDSRFYQLAGICMHHLKLWCIADYLYFLAGSYGGAEPTTLIYQAEVKVMLDEKVEAKALLLEGLKLAEGQAPLQDVYARGQFLLKQLAA